MPAKVMVVDRPIVFSGAMVIPRYLQHSKNNSNYPLQLPSVGETIKNHPANEEYILCATYVRQPIQLRY